MIYTETHILETHNRENGTTSTRGYEDYRDAIAEYDVRSANIAKGTTVTLRRKTSLVVAQSVRA